MPLRLLVAHHATVVPDGELEVVMAVEEDSALVVDLGTGLEQARLCDGLLVPQVAKVGLQVAEVGLRRWFLKLYSGLDCESLWNVVGSCCIFVDFDPDLDWELREGKRTFKY